MGLSNGPLAARVLVVDDDLIMRHAVCWMLHRGGYQALPADGARHALEIIKNDPPVHLVISDIAIPEMRGTQLIREMARLSPQTAGLLMTGHSIKQVDLPDG